MAAETAGRKEERASHSEEGRTAIQAALHPNRTDVSPVCFPTPEPAPQFFSMLSLSPTPRLIFDPFFLNPLEVNQ